jgi:alkylhydroperoxidase/carboxymuconolactone decarboxylase family protein YurZ
MNDRQTGSYRRGRALLRKMLGAREAERLRKSWRRMSPAFEEYVLTFLAGEIWSRPGLDLRTRSLVTIAALAALGRTNGLALNIRMALHNGATPEEIMETLLHLGPYAGFPATWEAMLLAEHVFRQVPRGGR